MFHFHDLRPSCPDCRFYSAGKLNELFHKRTALDVISLSLFWFTTLLFLRGGQFIQQLIIQMWAFFFLLPCIVWASLTLQTRTGLQSAKETGFSGLLILSWPKIRDYEIPRERGSGCRTSKIRLSQFRHHEPCERSAFACVLCDVEWSEGHWLNIICIQCSQTR